MNRYKQLLQARADALKKVHALLDKDNPTAEEIAEGNALVASTKP